MREEIYNQDRAMSEIKACIASGQLNELGATFKKINTSTHITSFSSAQNYIVSRFTDNSFLPALEYLLDENDKFKINFADLELFLLRQAGEHGQDKILHFMQTNISNGRIKVTKDKIGGLLKAVFYTASKGHQASSLSLMTTIDSLRAQYPQFFEGQVVSVISKYKGLSGINVVEMLSQALYGTKNQERNNIFTSFNTALLYEFKDGKKLINLCNNLWAQNIALELIQAKELRLSEEERKKMFSDMLTQFSLVQLHAFYNTIDIKEKNAIEYQSVVKAFIDKRQLEKAISVEPQQSTKSSMADFKI